MAGIKRYIEEFVQPIDDEDIDELDILYAGCCSCEWNCDDCIMSDECTKIRIEDCEG